MSHRFKIAILFLVSLGLTSCNRFQVGPEEVETRLPNTEWYFDTVMFEIAPVNTAYAPDHRALQDFRKRLHENNICHKDRVAFVVHDRVEYSELRVWTIGDLLFLSNRRRTIKDLDSEDKNLVVFVPYISGQFLDFSGLRSLGGIQYQPTSFAIFKDGVGKSEASVLLHEFGHLIGMVKDPDRDNHDDDHKDHCANKRCVMFWTATQGTGDFDHYCKQYLKSQIARRNR